MLDPRAQRVYAWLKEAAAERRYADYKDAAALAELPARSRALANMLDSISTYEFLSGRPLITAIVIMQQSGMPPDGFFRNARDIGAHRGRDNMDYWIHEVRRVHQHWGHLG